MINLDISFISEKFESMIVKASIFFTIIRFKVEKLLKSKMKLVSCSYPFENEQYSLCAEIVLSEGLQDYINIERTSL